MSADLGPPPARACDGCQACCVVLEVAELGKPAHTPCRQLLGSGCGIYEDRPDICRGFACNWAMGDPWLPAEARPDRTGLIVWIGRTAAGLTVFVHHLRPGAADDPRIADALSRYRARWPVMEERADGSRWLGLVGQEAVRVG